MGEYTKGPWKVADEDFIVGARYVAVVKRWSPVAAGSQYDDIEAKLKAEADANARLIAAAPELLEALEALQTEIRQAVKFDVKKHYSLMVADAAASKAVAKARGEE